MFCCARVAASSALARFSSSSASAGPAGVDPRFDVGFDLLEPAAAPPRARAGAWRTRWPAIRSRSTALSSSARRTSNRAVSSSTLSCAACTSRSALLLDDFLLRFRELRLRLLERVLLLGRIELDDHLAGLDRPCRVGEREDAQRAADRRRDQHRRLRRAQLAGGVHAQLERPATSRASSGRADRRRDAAARSMPASAHGDERRRAIATTSDDDARAKSRRGSLRPSLAVRPRRSVSDS